MSDRGSAVISALAGITLATTVTVSTLALGLSAVNVMVIRDAAIDAAQQAALAKSSTKNDYLLKLVKKRVPSMVSVRVNEVSEGPTTKYRVEGQLPGLGFLSGLTQVSVEVSAANEAIL